MDANERKAKTTELKAYHAGIIPFGSYFIVKCPHVPEGKDYKHIGLYESEAGKGDDVYLELVTMDYHPLDSSRTLYMWKHNPNYKKDYDVKKEQYMIPVSELRVVGTPIYIAGTDPYVKEGEDVKEVYITKHFKTKNGGKIEAVWKNGIPNKIIIQEKNTDQPLLIQEPIIEHILNIFK